MDRLPRRARSAALVSRYRIEITRSAARDLDRMVGKDYTAVAGRIDGLAEDPCPPGSARLKGRTEYKLRVGRFRIVYEVQDARLIVLIVIVDDRKQVYKRLRRG